MLGNIKTELDRFTEALEAYEMALAIHKELGNDWEVSSALNNLANLKDCVAEDFIDDEKINDSTYILLSEAVAMHQQALTQVEHIGH